MASDFQFFGHSIFPVTSRFTIKLDRKGQLIKIYYTQAKITLMMRDRNTTEKSNYILQQLQQTNDIYDHRSRGIR